MCAGGDFPYLNWFYLRENIYVLTLYGKEKMDTERVVKRFGKMLLGLYEVKLK